MSETEILLSEAMAIFDKVEAAERRADKAGALVGILRRKIERLESRLKRLESRLIGKHNISAAHYGRAQRAEEKLAAILHVATEYVEGHVSARTLAQALCVADIGKFERRVGADHKKDRG